MEGLLDYSEGDTVLHRMNPLTKIAVAFCICIAAFATSNFAVLFALLALNVGLGVWAASRAKR